MEIFIGHSFSFSDKLDIETKSSPIDQSVYINDSFSELYFMLMYENLKTGL